MKKSSRKKFLLLIPATLGLFFAPGCAHGLFYYPTRAWDSTPATRSHAVWENVQFPSTDGVKLHGWWIPAQGEPKGTVVHFHGNARNIGNHIGFSDWLPAAGYNLFLFDYRGYGQSAGTISRKGLVNDGVAALAYAAGRKETPSEQLYVWAQSLGGTVALQSLLRTTVPVRAAIIDSAFSSHARIASEKMKLLPWWLAWLRPLRPLFVRSGYDADDALRRLPEMPLLFLHGEKDSVIPASHSQRLYAIAKNPKHLWIVPGADHCDAVLRFPERVRPALLRFFATPGDFPAP